MMVKENDGKQLSNRFRRRVMLSLVLITFFLAIVRTISRIRIPARVKSMSRGYLKNPYANMFDSHHPLERAILEAKYFLIDIDVSFGALAADDGENSTHYGTVTGTFCPLDWSLQKTNPSTVPMFRSLVEDSKHCNPNRVRMDLRSITKKARIYDKAMLDAVAQHREIPITKVLQVGGAVFHESRCGSTLVSNLLVAANPQAHRVYSESTPPINVLRVCNSCSRAKQIALLRDVVYLMSRSQTPHETRVFFKIQSIGTHAISLWTEAFPSIPWAFVYRDPVEVLASHLRRGGDSAHRAPCLRSRDHPTPILIDLVARHHFEQNPSEGMPDATTATQLVSKLSTVEFCAAHLATLCTSALEEYRTKHSHKEGRFVNYASLPDIMWESVLPNHFDVEDLSEAHIERMKSIALVYSKGFQDKANKPWSQDTDIKQKRASEAMRQAAKDYLNVYFEQLEGAANQGNENDEENVAAEN